MEKYLYRGKPKEQDPNEIIKFRVVSPFTYQNRLMVTNEIFENVRHLKWTSFANKDLAVAIEDKEEV